MLLLLLLQRQHIGLNLTCHPIHLGGQDPQFVLTEGILESLLKAAIPQTLSKSGQFANRTTKSPRQGHRHQSRQDQDGSPNAIAHRLLLAQNADQILLWPTHHYHTCGIPLMISEGAGLNEIVGAQHIDRGR